MRPRTTPTLRAAALTATAVLSLSACDVVFQDTNSAKTADQWKRSYALAQGGQVEITNVNGPIEVTASNGSTVDIVADLTASGATEQLAKDLLKGIKIGEQVTADRIRIDVSRTAEDSGFQIGPAGHRSVAFKVAVPGTTPVKVSTRSGSIRITDVAGTVKAESTNGAITCRGVSGAVNASTTNGSISVEVAAVRPDGIRLDTTNGSIDVRLPADAKATIAARWVHGGFSTMGLSPEGESDRRHYDGKLNGGGPLIELNTTNGVIRMRSPDAARQ